MISAERLTEIGLSQEDVAEFVRLETLGQYTSQERLLRRYRTLYLDDVHKNEKRISDLDYILYEMKREHEQRSGGDRA